MNPKACRTQREIDKEEPIGECNWCGKDVWASTVCQKTSNKIYCNNACHSLGQDILPKHKNGTDVNLLFKALGLRE